MAPVPPALVPAARSRSRVRPRNPLVVARQSPSTCSIISRRTRDATVLLPRVSMDCASPGGRVHAGNLQGASVECDRNARVSGIPFPLPSSPPATHRWRQGVQKSRVGARFAPGGRRSRPVPPTPAELVPLSLRGKDHEFVRVFHDQVVPTAGHAFSLLLWVGPGPSRVHSVRCRGQIRCCIRQPVRRPLWSLGKRSCPRAQR